MNKILKVIFLIVLTLDLSACSSAPTPSPTIYQEAGVEIIDKRFTEPDCYEILRRTKFENGLIIDQWHEVSKDEYERTEVMNE